MGERDHHGREYSVAFISIIGEYLAVKYSITWLAWLASFFLWLALIGYTGKYFLSKANSTPWLKYGFRSVLAVAIAVATYWLTYQKMVPTVDAQQQEPKKPDVQQNSQGATNSPNTNITVNNNTVKNTVVINRNDPKAKAQLNRIEKLLLDQQDQLTPKKLLARYPLG